MNSCCYVYDCEHSALSLGSLGRSTPRKSVFLRQFHAQLPLEKEKSGQLQDNGKKSGQMCSKMPYYNHGLEHRCHNVSKTLFYPSCKANKYKIAYSKLSTFNLSLPK